MVPREAPRALRTSCIWEAKPRAIVAAGSYGISSTLSTGGARPSAQLPPPSPGTYVSLTPPQPGLEFPFYQGVRAMMCLSWRGVARWHEQKLPPHLSLSWARVTRGSTCSFPPALLWVGREVGGAARIASLAAQA